MGENHQNMTILKEFEPQSLISKKIIIFLAILVMGITILEIWAVNRLATYGNKISQLENTRSELMLQNQLLENQIAQRSSLQETQELAKKLGFEHIKNLSYLKEPGLALNR